MPFIWFDSYIISLLEPEEAIYSKEIDQNSIKQIFYIKVSNDIKNSKNQAKNWPPSD